MKKLKVYFAGAMRGGRRYFEEYKVIAKQLEEMNIDVLTKHVIDSELESSLSNQQIFERDLKSLEKADFVIAEVSMPSLGVGYEVCEALHLSKPTLCLCCDNIELSALINGNTSPKIRICRYRDVKECASIIQEFIEEFKLR
jgi:nucleoside 2-deoxyribosyltransferase